MTKSVMPKDEVFPQIKIIPVDLPPPDTERWVPRRKATIVNAVHSGVMSPAEVCRCYELSVEEFVTWQRAIETHGIAGLHVTRTQFYRSAPPTQPAHHSEATIQTGKLLVNLDTRVVSVQDRPVRLTKKEYSILELLSLRKGTILTKEMFLDHLYGGMDEPEIKIIDVFVCKLRKKLAHATGGKHYIETVWGRGYALRDPAPMATATPVMGPEHLAARDDEGWRESRLRNTRRRAIRPQHLTAG
jgi:DNA-binding winged helix-turn-helix (wHTH) protein